MDFLNEHGDDISSFSIKTGEVLYWCETYSLM
jgi:hypothetical protein